MNTAPTNNWIWTIISEEESNAKRRISDKRTEIVLKDSPLSRMPRKIYSMIETDDCDIVEYDYYEYHS